MINKVYIGIPSRSKGHWGTYTGLIGAISTAAPKGIQCMLDPHVGSSLICRARQNITYKFLYENPDYNYFLQVDDDVQLPRDAIVKMVEADKNVVGGMYSIKSTAGKIAMRAKGDKKLLINDHPDQLVEVQYLSTGCFLQKREVVQKAWNEYEEDRGYLLCEDDSGLSLEQRKRVAMYTPFIYKQEYLSEDWAYCQRLIDMWELIWAHTGVKCVHWGLAPYGIE